MTTSRNTSPVRAGLACALAFALAPSADATTCLQLKLTAVGKHAAAVFACRSKAAAHGTAVDPACLAKADAAFTKAFAKAELRPDCSQTGDAAAVDAAFDACVTDIDGAVLPTTTTTVASTTSTTTTVVTTTTTTIPSNPACVGSEPASLAGILAAQNAVRANASPAPVPPLDPLCWNDDAASVAQAWASHCTFGHNPTAPYGENLFAVAFSGPTPPADVELTAVNTWASEGSTYDYVTNTCSSGSNCVHYKQIVARSTVAVGCGMAVCSTGSPFAGLPNWVFVVCDYTPLASLAGQPY